MSERKKIAKVITECNDCPHKRTLIEERGNTYYALVCDYQPDSNEYNKPFLICFTYSHPKHSGWEIPENCPLEDYKQAKD